MKRALLLSVLVASAALAPAGASAQELGGAINGHLVLAGSDVGVDVGGGASVDLWASFEWLRIGGFMGALAIPSGRDPYNRLAMPVGVSVALQADLGDVTLGLRLRGGVWGGATQAAKMTIGGFLGGGPYLGIDLGGGVSTALGVEVWGFLADSAAAGQTWAVAPSLSLVWGPGSTIEELPPAADETQDEGIAR
jgi:hypothetical protein